MFRYRPRSRSAATSRRTGTRESSPEVQTPSRRRGKCSENHRCALRENDCQTDLRQVGVSIRTRIQAMRKGTARGEQHHQVPEPAEQKEWTTIPQPNNHPSYSEEDDCRNRDQPGRGKLAPAGIRRSQPHGPNRSSHVDCIRRQDIADSGEPGVACGSERSFAPRNVRTQEIAANANNGIFSITSRATAVSER